MSTMHHESRLSASAHDARHSASGRNGRSIADLVRKLRDEGAALFRQELELAKTETVETASRTLRNIAYLGVGAALSFMALGFLLLGLSRGLIIAMIESGMEEKLALWLGPVIVGALVAVISGGMIIKGVHTLKNEKLIPPKTKASMKETKEWLQEKVS